MATNESARDGRAGITAALVRALVHEQFPRWSDLPVTPVETDGWDNRTYRLGDAMTVRLPSHARYAAAVDKEDRWLPVLAPHLPAPVPIPIATGMPGQGYPFRWSVRQWLDGRTAAVERVGSMTEFATAVAEFILALQGIDATGGPPAGEHSFYRGASLAHYDAETRESVTKLGDMLDGRRALEAWDAALATTWQEPPVWVHGDMATGNLLVRDGQLAAVIDFGTCAVGDPACDLVIAWTFFDGTSRAVFRDRVGLDDGTWARARGWALWKALITSAGGEGDPAVEALNRHIIAEVLADARG